MKKTSRIYWREIGLLLLATALNAHAESGTDVSPICTTVSEELSSNALLSRGAFCQKSAEVEYQLRDVLGDEVGRVGIVAYSYSDNPLNRFPWALKYRFRARVISGSASPLMIKAVVGCQTAPDCAVAPNTGVDLVVGGLSNEIDVSLTPNMPANNLLLIQPTLEYWVVKSGESFEDGPSKAAYVGFGYIPDIRCDVGLAKAGTRGCVYINAPAVMRTVKIDNPDVSESAIHIKEAQADGLPGKFVLSADGTIKPGFGSSFLTRLRLQSARDANRRTSKEQCFVIYGAVNGTCIATGDPDEILNDGDKCDCDEYPFASTNQGAFTNPFSVKQIDASDNRRSGALLGNFYSAERVLDGDAFYVDVEPPQ